jgi:hypothetical protein
MAQATGLRITKVESPNGSDLIVVVACEVRRVPLAAGALSIPGTDSANAHDEGLRQSIEACLPSTPGQAIAQDLATPHTGREPGDVANRWLPRAIRDPNCAFKH